MPSKKSHRPGRPPKPRPRGRPPVRIMPDPIPDTPENVVQALCQGPPAGEWDFMKPGGAGHSSPTPPTRRSPNR